MSLIEKRDFYIETNPNDIFLSFRHLSGVCAENIFFDLLNGFGIIQSKERFFDHRTLLKKTKKIISISEHSSLLESLIIDNLKLSSYESIFLNYKNFEEFFEINVKDLIEYFDDIYFPSADEIEIFDRSGKWLIHVSESEDVFVGYAS